MEQHIQVKLLSIKLKLTYILFKIKDIPIT